MYINKAKELIQIEAQAVSDLVNRIDENFENAIDLMSGCKGRVVICGMGKTGLIGRKIAATLSSTGTPSVFLHSAEAVHGDLGQLTSDDVLVVISNSGETEETVRLLPLIKRLNAKVIAMTGNSQSSLAKHSDIVLNVDVEQEGCPLGLAPMASTTATLVMGDALAACLILKKQFKQEDFALNHPGGSLGRKLLWSVEDVMRDSFPKVESSMSVKDVLLSITKYRCGSACIVDKEKLIGIFTDGDLRRHIESGVDILQKPVEEVMTKNPLTIEKSHLAAEALRIMQDKNIDEIPVTNEKGQLVGLLDVQDLLKAGIV